MTKNKDVNKRIADSPRIAELVGRFASMSPEDAQKQIAILPYYHQLENEITKPNQGVFTTRYFVTKWRQSLGAEAASIVLALRLLANQDGETFASQELIADYAGMSVRSLKRWLSENDEAVMDRSDRWKMQWSLLHNYFLRSKTSRYIIRREGTLSRAKRTTNLYAVAMDDPVHPDDMGELHVKAAERIVKEEESNSLSNNDGSYKGPMGPNRKKQILFESDPVDNSPYKGPMGPNEDGPNGPSLSSSYRSNVNNVREISKKQTLRTHPAIQAMSREEKARRESMALEIGDQLSTMAGDRKLDVHQSAGFHSRIAFLLPERFVYEALVATRDAMDDQRAGRKKLRSGPAAYFAGIVRQIAERENIDLGIEWKVKSASESR